jgi:hypothetical protein
MPGFAVRTLLKAGKQKLARMQTIIFFWNFKRNGLPEILGWLSSCPILRKTGC